MQQPGTVFWRGGLLVGNHLKVKAAYSMKNLCGILVSVLSLYSHGIAFCMGSLFLGGLWAVVRSNIKVSGTWIPHLHTAIYRVGGLAYSSKKLC